VLWKDECSWRKGSSPSFHDFMIIKWKKESEGRKIFISSDEDCTHSFIGNNKKNALE
jgi:hypothetical protein